MIFDMPPKGSWEVRGGWVVNRLVTEFGITFNQAAGIVGNLGHESLGFKTLQEIKPLVPGSRGGYGWAQWTGPRRRRFEAWCEAFSLRPASDEANYGFLVAELESSHKYVLASLRHQNSLDDAVFDFGRLYENPHGTTETHLPGFGSRLGYGKRALQGALATTDPIAAIKSIQRVLVDFGYESVVDGDFGEGSIRALNQLLLIAGQSLIKKA